MDNINTSFNDVGLFAVIIAVIGVIFTLVLTTHKPLTVSGYIINTNLYILLVILLITLTIIVLDKYDLFNALNVIPSTVAFVISIILVFALATLDHKQIVLRHILWTLLVIDVAFILFPLFEEIKDTNALWKILTTAIILLITLTYITIKYKADIFNSFGSYLLIGLFALIIYQILNLVFPGRSENTYQKIYGIIGLILFAGFILYDTNNVYKRAEQAVLSCNDMANQLACADYISESLKLHFRYCGIYEQQQ